MQRFDDQPLRPMPHLAVLFQDKLGGFVAATPLLRGLKEKYPGAILDYFGGERTAELELACRFVDARFSLYGRPGALRELPSFIAEREARHGPYDLAINLDFSPVNAVAMATLQPSYAVGRSFRPDGRAELAEGSGRLGELGRPTTFWADENFVTRFADVLSTGFIGEIFCRLARVETDYQRTEVPSTPGSIELPPVLVATGGTRSAKLWPRESWRHLIERCERAGISVGLLGAAPAIQQASYGSGDIDATLLAETSLVDLRGKLSLPQVAGALARARACVTVDNGIMHLAAAVGTPTIALFGASPWELWAPRVGWLSLALPSEPCGLCRDNRFLNDGCLRERHVCMESVSADAVFERLLALLVPAL